MKWKLIKPLLFIFAVFTIMGTQCDKFDYPSRNLQYDFTQSISLNPYNKQYLVGDTIWMSLNTPSKILFDKKSGQLIGADSIYLGLQLNMVKLIPLTPPADPASYCEFLIPSNLNPAFNNYGTGYAANLRYGCDNNPGYIFRFGVVLKGGGTFSLELIEKKETGLCIPNNSMNVTYSQITPSFNLVDCNKDVYLGIPASARGNMSLQNESKIDRKQYFVFEVH